MMYLNLLGMLLVFPALTYAQDNRDSPNDRRLESVVRDHFSKDSRPEYKIVGDVQWEEGSLLIVEDAVMERAFTGGPWTTVKLKSEPIKLTAQRPIAELRVWFMIDGESNCYVRLRERLQDGNTVSSVALVDTVERDGKPLAIVVREMTTDDAKLRDISIEYRHGLFRVDLPGVDAFYAHVVNGSSPVRAISLQSHTSAHQAHSLTVATEVPARYSDEEKQQLVQADAENQKLIDLYQQGKFAVAAKVGEKVLAIRKSILGERHSEYGTSLNNLATIYQAMGDYDRAEPLLHQASDIQKSVLGDNHPLYATSLLNLGSTREAMGDYTRAELLYKEAIEIEKLVLGEEHPGYAASLNNLALLYDRLGNYQDAESLYRQALGIHRSTSGERQGDYTTVLNNLAMLYYRTGAYKRAEPLFKETIEIDKSVLGEKHTDYALSLNNLAMLYLRIGDFAQAEPIFKEVIEILEAKLGKKHPNYALSRNNLAMLYFNMGDYARAVPIYKETIEIWKSELGDTHPNYAKSLSNLGATYFRMGQFNRAEPLYAQASDILKSKYGERHPEYAGNLNNVAMLSFRMGNYGRAELNYKKACKIWESTLGKNHPEYAGSLNGLASLYTHMGDYARAEQLFKQSVDIYRRQLNDNASIQSVRQQYRNQNELRRFLDDRLANAIAASLADNTIVADDLWAWKGAVTERQQAYRTVSEDPMLAPLFDQLQSVTRQLSVVAGNIPAPPIESAPEAAKNAYQHQRESWEQAVANLTRKREGLEQDIAAGSLRFRHIIEPLTADAIGALLPSGATYIDFLAYNHSTPDQETVGKTNYERRFLAVVVSGDGSVQLVELGSANQIGDAISKFRLPFMRGKNTITNRNSAADAARELREAIWVPIEKHLADTRTVVVSPDSSLGTLPFAALPGKSDGTYLIEEYKFVSLPLAGMLRSLNEDRTGQPTAEKGLLVLGDVNYDANATVEDAQSAEETQLVATTRSAPRGDEGKWLSLVGFQRELSIVRSQYESSLGGRVTTLQRNQATENEFILGASRHSILHVITHGYFADPEFEPIGYGSSEERSFHRSPRDRMAADKTINQHLPGVLSGLVLAGANNPPPANDPSADGILTASEIEVLNLNHVDLAVLSACETGLGKSAGGEGLTGLQRAFHVAGVRSVVASLWEVDDTATQELMKRFYANLWEKKQSKIDALRNAQLWLLQNPEELEKVGVENARTRGAPRKLSRVDPNAKRRNSDRTSPYFWAAFQLSGDWR